MGEKNGEKFHYNNDDYNGLLYCARGFWAQFFVLFHMGRDLSFMQVVSV